MPELPEVETIKTAIQNSVAKANITKVTINNNNLRIKIPDDFVRQVVGARIQGYRRRAKYIIIDLNNGKSIILHLGMSGKIKISDRLPEPVKHDHVVIETDNGVIVYNDARRFGLLTCCDSDKLAGHKLFAHIGVEPWDEILTGEYLYKKFHNKKIPVKMALLDQSIIVGIGNIYASESLYLARIDPQKEAGALSESECVVLVAKIRQVLEQAISAGGSTLKDYQKPDGSLGYFQNRHCVYNKTGQRCPDCTCDIEKSGGIRKIVQGGRSTFYCPVKQK